MEEVKQNLGELGRFGDETVRMKGRSSEGQVCCQADTLDWRIHKMAGWLLLS